MSPTQAKPAADTGLGMAPAAYARFHSLFSNGVCICPCDETAPIVIDDDVEDDDVEDEDDDDDEVLVG
jgi:hypothetical protein